MKQVLKTVFALLLCLGLNATFAQTVPFPSQPPYNTLAPWGYTNVGTNFNTSAYLPFIYQNLWFRIIPPNGVTYNRTTNTWTNANGSQKYPLMIFSTGAGERGTDNNAQLKHGGQVHMQAVQSGRFPGFVVFYQTSTGYLESGKLLSLINKLITTLPIDQDRIYNEGLSRGGTNTWEHVRDLPKIFAATFPMSAASGSFFSMGSVHIPARLAQGGLDSNPAPYEAYDLVEAYEQNGGNLKFYFFPTLGHGTWNTCYALPDFYEWFLAQRKNQIHVFFGQKDVCPGSPINVKLGMTGGFDGYEWRKDGVLIPGATSNDYTATEYGSYTARFRRGSVWTEWSAAVSVGVKQPTTTPAITTNGLKSIHLPAPDGTTTAEVTLPDGYLTYEYRNSSTNELVGSSRVSELPVGTFFAKVTEKGGCSTIPSPNFTVVNAAGPNAPDAISNLRISPSGLTSLKLDWDNVVSPVNDETGFEIYRSDSDLGPWKLVRINAANTLTYTDNGLISGNRYFYIVRAINATGASAVSPAETSVTGLDTQVPTAPLNLTVTAVTPSSVSLRWNLSTDNVGVVAYDVFVNGVKAYSITSTANPTNFTVNGLVTSQWYNFTVRARDAAGNNSAPSMQVTRYTVNSGLTYKYYHGDWNVLPNFNALTPIKTGWVSNYSLTPRTQNDFFGFTFDGKLNITTAGSYTFFLSSDDGSKLWIDGNLVVNYDGLHGAGEVAGSPITLTAGIHTIYVEQFEKSGGEALTVRYQGPNIAKQVIPNSALTDVAPAITLPVAPATPTATALSYESVRINWAAYSDANATRLEVHRLTGSTWNVIATIARTETSFTDVGLAANTTYQYRLRAIGQYGESGYSGARSIRTLTLPAAPIAPTLMTGTPAINSIVLGWNDNSNNETSFELYRSKDTNTAYSLVATLPSNPTALASYSDTNLFAHTLYFYKVRARNVGGASAFAPEISRTTLNSNPVAAPVDNFTMRYSDIKELTLTASDADGDAVFFETVNLPAFANLYDYGDGTAKLFFEPDSTISGAFPNLQVRVIDAFGGSALLTFNMEVNSNFAPVITSIAPTSVKETHIVTGSITGMDQDGNPLTWEVLNAPEFFASVAAGNTLNYTIEPAESTAGTYLLDIRLKDDQGGSTDGQLQVTILPYDATYKVYVNFGNATTVPAPWQNARVQTSPVNAGTTFTNLNTSTSTLSPISIIFDTPWDGTSNQNASASATPTIPLYTTDISRSYFWSDGADANETFRITGLNPNNKYNLDFYSSRKTNTNRLGIYTINGTSVTVNATDNASNLASFKFLVPDASGTITVNLRAGSVAPDNFIYLNSLVLESFYDGKDAPRAPENFALGYSESDDIQLTWSDIATNEFGYEVYRSEDGINFSKIANTATNAVSFDDKQYTPLYTYYYTIRAFNGNGFSANSDTLSIEGLNKAPSITPISPITVSEGLVRHVTVTGTDPEGGAVSFFLDSAPGFIYLQSINNTTADMVISPQAGDNGTYNFYLVAMDSYGEMNYITVTVNVSDLVETLVYVNFTHSGTNAGAPWNNTTTLIGGTPPTLSNIKDSFGGSTGFTITPTTGWSNTVNSGTTAGPYPVNVTQTGYNISNTTPRTLRIRGVSFGKKYDLSLYASRMETPATNRNSTFTVGSKSVTINASNNVNQVALLAGITPTLIAGSVPPAYEINLVVSKPASSSFAHLNALILREYTDSGIPVAPTNLTTNVLTRSSIQLSWVDQNEAETGYEIERKVGTGPWTLITTTAANAQTFTNTGLAQNTTYTYRVRAVVNPTLKSDYSTESAATTFVYSVSINFGAVNLAPSPWNNITAFLGLAGDRVNNLADDNGANSGMSLVIVEPFTDDNSNGMNTGNNSGIVPDAVMESAYWLDPGVPASIRIEGLSFLYTYNFGFFTSRNGGGNRNTNFTIGTKTVTQNAAYNTSIISQIKDVVPDANGGVTINIVSAPGSSFGYLNGLVIQAATLQTGGAEASAYGETVDVNNANVIAYPNPFTNRISVVSDYSAEIKQVAVMNTTGNVLFHGNPEFDSTGAASVDLSDKNLINGLYIVQVEFADGAKRALKLFRK